MGNERGIGSGSVNASVIETGSNRIVLRVHLGLVH